MKKIGGDATKSRSDPSRDVAEEEEDGGWQDDENGAMGEAKEVGEGRKRCRTACGYPPRGLCDA